MSKLGLATIGLSSRAIVPHIPLREESEVWSIRSPGHLGPGVRGGAGIIPHITTLSDEYLQFDECSCHVSFEPFRIWSFTLICTTSTRSNWLQ